MNETGKLAEISKQPEPSACAGVAAIEICSIDMIKLPTLGAKLEGSVLTTKIVMTSGGTRPDEVKAIYEAWPAVELMA